MGSGKTIVSLLSILNVIESGYQCALMSPTKFANNIMFIKKTFKNINIKIDFLTGKTEYKLKKNILNNLKNGNTQLVVGTCFISKKIDFKNLDL